MIVFNNFFCFASYVYTCMYTDPVSLKPWLRWRFWDDNFCLWTHVGALLIEFLDFLSNFHSTIKFTSTFLDTLLPFLDVLVSINNSCISTDLYCKPTDARQSLDSKSCHPFHFRRAIPYSQALRLRCICSDGDNVREADPQVMGKGRRRRITLRREGMK